MCAIINVIMDACVQQSMDEFMTLVRPALIMVTLVWRDASLYKCIKVTVRRKPRLVKTGINR
jgi:hypothetical protein